MAKDRALEMAQLFSDKFFKQAESIFGKDAVNIQEDSFAKLCGWVYAKIGESYSKGRNDEAEGKNAFWETADAAEKMRKS